jgi:hypothetical protein
MQMSYQYDPNYDEFAAQVGTQGYDPMSFYTSASDKGNRLARTNGYYSLPLWVSDALGQLAIDFPQYQGSRQAILRDAVVHLLHSRMLQKDSAEMDEKYGRYVKRAIVEALETEWETDKAFYEQQKRLLETCDSDDFRKRLVYEFTIDLDMSYSLPFWQGEARKLVNSWRIKLTGE